MVLDPTDPRPPYRQIADQLREAIRSGEIGAGSPLPSERELVDRYGTAAQTVREAVKVLKAEGLVISRPGRGVYVRERSPIAITLSAENYHRHQREGQAGFNAQVREQGHTPRQEIIEVAVIPVPDVAAERLRLAEGSDVVMRHLRFLVDDVPVLLVRAYYPRGLAAGGKLEQSSLISGGAHAELRQLGKNVTRFVEEFAGARLPKPEEARSLLLPRGVPVIRNIRTAYAGDQPVEVIDSLAHGEVVSFKFEIEL